MPMNEKDQPVTQITRFEDTPEYKAFALRMQDMLDTGENPYFICHDSALTDTSVVDGQRLINFGSYNYVGMSGRKEVSEAAKRRSTSTAPAPAAAASSAVRRHCTRPWKKRSPNGNGPRPAWCWSAATPPM